MQTLIPIHNNQEEAVLAACYRLLLQKAQERRERLAKTAVTQNQTVDNQSADPNQNDS